MDSEDKEVYALLEDITITGVEPTGQKLGCGAFGVVFGVTYDGNNYAAKQIYPILIESPTPGERKAFIENFIGECRQFSALNHPNIVRFIGVYYPSKQSDLPIMVMELMNTSLSTYVESNQSNIPVKTKISILFDVSLGVNYLHTLEVVHRDLTPKNVLLTDQLVAKIGDFGVSKVIPADSKRTLTREPGARDFMPPETFEVKPQYGTAVDVFSFAGIVLHVFAEQWPTPSNVKMQDPITKRPVALTEAKRRQKYLDKIPKEVAILKIVAQQCLEDEPSNRPSMEDIVTSIKKLKVKILL